MLGIREGRQLRNQSIVIRTKLVGDVIVGMQCKGAIRDWNFGVSAPLTMIYGEPKQGSSINLFGAYCRIPADEGPANPVFRLPNPSGSTMDDNAYFSWAPLSGVSSTLVFYDEHNGACKGILFRYRNGGARAVGQCRLQVDPTQGVDQPVRVCFRVDSCSSRFNRTLYLTRVKFEQTPQAGGTAEVEGWESHQMEGMIKFWFTTESGFVAVEDGVPPSQSQP